MIKTNKIMSRNVMYEPPMVEVIEVEVEGGFAVSGYALIAMILNFIINNVL